MTLFLAHIILSLIDGDEKTAEAVDVDERPNPVQAVHISRKAFPELFPMIETRPKVRQSLNENNVICTGEDKSCVTLSLTANRQRK